MPLNETLTISPGWKPVPLTVTDVPAAACDGDVEMLAAGAGVPVALVAGVAVPPGAGVLVAAGVSVAA